MILGIVPARAGSKGIPQKAIYPLVGKPLIEYTLDAADESNLGSYVISTNMPEILSDYPFTMDRPDELAQDDTPTMPVIQYVIAKYERLYNVRIDAVMLLQPTSPLRTAQHINESLDRYTEGGYGDSLISVYEGIHPKKCYDAQGNPFIDNSPYDKHRDKCYTRNGAIFIISRKLIDEGILIGDDPIFYVMDKISSIDIDDMQDLEIADAILRARRG